MTQGFAQYDPKIAQSFNSIVDRHAEYHRRLIWSFYTNRDVLENYEALRQAYQIEDWKSGSAMRELYRPPHRAVHRFIDHEMTKKYGSDWIKDKATFRKVCKKEELIRPWLIVPVDKI